MSDKFHRWIGRTVSIRYKAEPTNGGFRIPPGEVLIDGIRRPNLKSVTVHYDAGRVPVVTVAFIPGDLDIELDVPNVVGIDKVCTGKLQGGSKC